jgi:hypothetical protein
MDNNWFDFKDEIINKQVKAVFSYRDLNILDINEFVSIAKFKVKSVATPFQTHSVNVKKVSKEGNFGNVDGLFTSNSSIICSVKVADCMPVFFIHKTKSFYGIVHVGWRGLVGGILKNAIILMKVNKINLEDIQVFVGPSIQKCCFEVGQDIVGLFNKNFIKNRKNRKYSVDLHGSLKFSLESYGIKSNQIDIFSECTFCNVDKYFSYRRDGEKTGRMYGLVGKI